MTTIPIKLYASQANEWSVCPLYATMNGEYAIPELEGEFNESAEDGIVAHGVVEDVVLRQSQLPVINSAIDRSTYNHEMEYFVKTCLEFIASHSNWEIETKFRLESLHEMIRGRRDFTAYNLVEHVVTSADFKYGRTYIEEYKNRQTILAALEYIEKYNIETIGLRIELAIIQTRAYGHEPIRGVGVYYSYEDLLEEREIMRQAAIEAQKGLEAKAVPGAHCSKCNGRHACKYNSIGVWSNIDNLPKRADVVLTGAQASKELFFLEKQLALLEGRVTALKSQVEFDIRSGKSMDYHKMERGRKGDLVWLENVTADDIEMIGALNGKELVVKKPITPTQAGALVGADVIAPFSKRLPSKEKLVAIENKDRQKELDHLKIEL